MKLFDKIKNLFRPRCVMRRKPGKNRPVASCNWPEDDSIIVKRREVQGTRKTDGDNVRVFRKSCYYIEKRAVRAECDLDERFVRYYQSYEVLQNRQNVRNEVDREIQGILDNMNKKNWS